MTAQDKLRAKAAKLCAPKPRELPSGAWRCEVMVQGRRISVVDDDPEVAHAKALAIKTGMLQDKKSPAAMTVGEAIDRYIESKDGVLSPSTVAGYRRIRENALQDLMEVRLPALTQDRVQRAVNAMAKARSPKSVANAHGLLSAALAVYWPDMVLRTTLPQKRRYEPAIPSDDDVRAIMEETRGSRDELPVLLAVWLGLRMSEILGLKWGDVDGDILHIRRALVDEGEKGTKTYGSQRDLPLPIYLRELIARAPYIQEHIVPMTRRTLYCRFQALCKRAGVQHYRFHDLRHINASVMLALGVPNKYAQERMGHATDNMLKTVYQHTMSAEQIAVAKKVDDYFEQKLRTIFRTEENGGSETQRV